MTIHYPVESLTELFLSDQFVSDKHTYITSRKSEITNLQKFLNSIDINKNYYRNSIHVKNPKYKKKLSGDTIIIHNFKASLNKMSSLNYKDLCSSICESIQGKPHLYPILCQYIIEQSLLHHNYSTYYVELVEGLQRVFNNRDLVCSQIDNCYQRIIDTVIDDSSEYSTLCSKNKQIDQLIGYSVFIAKLEMKGIIEGRIEPSIQTILDTMGNPSMKEDELYKCVMTIYNIFKIIFSDKPMKAEYITTLTTIKESISFMKVKFKIMDILERR